jgi:two-component system, chemotaxis family, CheB/CheR fusion protein
MNEELHQRGMDLNSSNAFLEAVLASLPAAAVVVDRNLRILSWNDNARDLWGLNANEAVGQHFLNLDIGRPVEKLHGAMRSVLSDGGNREILSLDATTRRGRNVVARVELAPLHYDGSTDGVILLMEPEEAA